MNTAYGRRTTNCCSASYTLASTSSSSVVVALLLPHRRLQKSHAANAIGINGAQLVAEHCTFLTTSRSIPILAQRAKTSARNSILSLRRLLGYAISPGCGLGSLDAWGCPTSASGRASYSSPLCVRGASRGSHLLTPITAVPQHASVAKEECIVLSKAKVVCTVRVTATVPIIKPLLYKGLASELRRAGSVGQGLPQSRPLRPIHGIVRVHTRLACIAKGRLMCLCPRLVRWYAFTMLPEQRRM